MFLHPLTRPFAGVIRTHYLRQKSTMSAAILPTCLIKKNISDGEAAKETKKHCDNLRTQKWSHDSVVTHDAITTHHNLIYEGSTGSSQIDLSSAHSKDAHTGIYCCI